MFILMIQMVILFFATYFFSIFVHEIGHFIFGLLSGYKIYQLKLFGYTIVENKKLCFKRADSNPKNQCLMTPTKYGKFTFILYNLGGILANLMVMLISLLLLLLTEHGKIIGVLFILLAVFNFYSLVLNGILLVIGGLPNDMKNVLLVNSSESAKRAFHSGFMIDFHLKQGKKMDKLEEQYFELPIDYDLENIYVAYNRMQQAIHKIELTEIENGMILLNELSQKVDSYKKYTYYYTIIVATISYYFYVYHKNIGIADNLSKEATFIQYGAEKNITEFQLCILAQRNKKDLDWEKTYEQCKKAIDACQSKGLKQLYINQLDMIYN